MHDSLAPDLSAQCIVLARVCCIAAVLTGGLALVGWALGVALFKSVLPQWPTMMPNTAICFILSGWALWLLLPAWLPARSVALRRKVGAMLGAALVAICGLLTLSQYVLGIDAGIDQILFPGSGTDVHASHTGRMAAATAFNFVLLGMALLVLNTGFRLAALTAQCLALIVLLNALVVALGYAYGAPGFYNFQAYGSVALHTALLLIVLSAGVWLARPGQELMEVFTSAGSGGVLARRLLPLIFGVPVILVWLRLQSEQRSLVSAEGGASLLVATSILIFGAVVWFSARLINRTETEQAEAARSVRDGQLRLSSLVNTAMDAIITVDQEQNIVLFNSAAERMFGYPASDMLGQTVDRLLPEPSRQSHAEHIRHFGASAITARHTRAMGPIHGLRADGVQFPIESSISQFEVDGQKLYTAVLRDITDRKRADDALQESEERFAGAFEYAPIGMALVSPEGQWIKVNRRLCDLLGYSAAELTTRTFQDITDPDDLEGDLANLSRMISGEISSYQMEKRYIHKHGHTVTVMLSVSLVRDEQRQPRSFVFQIQDITEARQAEARHLRQRDALIDLTTDAGTTYAEDPAAALQRITEVAAATLGVARASIWRYTDRQEAIRAVDLYEQVSGRHSAGMELLAADYPAYFRALASVEVISADDACRDPRTCECASGYLQPLGISAMLDAPIQMGGVVDGVLCHEHVGSPRVWTTDEKNFAVAMANLVSLSLEGAARKQAEEALRQSIAQLAMEKARLIAAQAVAKVGSWETDPFTGTVTWSDETHHIFETDPRTFKPSHQEFLQIVHPDDRRKVDEAFTGSLVVNSGFAIEHRVLMKDGRIKFVEERWRPVLDNHGQPLRVEGTCQDITERKQAEDELRHTSERLQALSRRLVEIQEAERRRMSAELHDRIGQNLTALGINLTIMGGALPEPLVKELAPRLDDTTRLLESTVALVRGLMTELRPAVLDDYGLVAALRALAEEFEERSGVATAVKGEELVPRLGQPLELALFRIAQEALNNTIKHGCAKRVQLALQAREGQVALTITDDGVGFDPLAPFRPGEQHWGLTLMQERAAAVGAQFRVESAPGEGTRIIVELAVAA